MRKLVSTVSGAAELLEYYPRWATGLAECERQYLIDEKSAEQLREDIATKMAQVLGEEVFSYLTLQRLYSSEPRDNWLNKWRSFGHRGHRWCFWSATSSALMPTLPNHRVQPTPYNVRCASASGRG